MEIREVDVHDEPMTHRHWEIGRAAEAAYRPYDFHIPWETAWATYQHGRDDVEVVRFGAVVDGLMVGAADLDLNRLDNLHSASGMVYVDPDFQRRGIGRALEAELVRRVAERGRRLLMTEVYAPTGAGSAGLSFAEALGYTAGIEDGIKIVDLVETEPTWAGLEQKAAERQGAYRVVTWVDHVPDELVEGYCTLSASFFEEAPMGELEVEPEKWDAQRVSDREARNARTGRHELGAGALAPDGTLVAITEVMVNERAGWRGLQSGTLVAPSHRGHRLGLAVKLANHRQLRASRPECRVLMTGNAGVNAPMNAVNDALGYREVERCVEMQKSVEGASSTASITSLRGA